MAHVPLTGRRIAADGWAALPRLAVGAAWFLGPLAWRINNAARSGATARVHQLERAWCSRVAEYLGVHFAIKGLDHVRPGGRYIVVTLHEGFADALALMHLGLDLRFVARAELLDWPTLGRYLQTTGQILIEPERGRASYRHMVETGRQVLDAGESLVICPQGSILGIEAAFWPGAFGLADKLEADVLPVVLTGSHRVWGYPYSPVVRFGQRVSMRVLPPVASHEAVASAERLEREMKRIALEPGMAPVRRFDPGVDGFWDDYSYEIDPAFPQLADVIDRHREGVRR